MNKFGLMIACVVGSLANGAFTLGEYVSTLMFFLSFNVSISVEIETNEAE